MNNKLGLKIVRINQGYTDLLEINGEQIWTNNIWDIREELKNIENLDGLSAVLMLTNVDTGHILTIASLISGRITDCISAWIYIPATIKITGKELVELVEITKIEILANERNDERLKQIFSKSYDDVPVAKMMAKSVGDNCAYRYYGQGTRYNLPELLNDMCQPYYSKYKSVFLLDNASNLKCSSGDDLTDNKVYPLILVNAPNAKDGFMPYMDDMPFEKQKYFTEDSKIRIEWRRKGYLSLTVIYEVKSDTKLGCPGSEHYQKIISHKDIQVLDELDRIMDSYTLYIEDKLVERGKGIPIYENKLNNVKVKICADGYDNYDKCCNLSKLIRVKLNKKIYYYEFILPLKAKNYSVENNSIIVNSDSNIKASPVNGYESRETILPLPKKNKLYYQPFTKKHLIFSAFVVALSLLIGIGAGWFLKGLLSKSEIKELKTEIKKLESRQRSQSNTTPQGNNNSVAKTNPSPNNDNDKTETSSNEEISVIEYLDSNKKWNRNEMEKYPETKGLWDAMNERRLDDILDYENQLSGSNQFNKVVECVKKNKNKKGLGAKYITKPNDFDISVDRYISKLNDLSSVSKEGNVSNNNASEDNNPNERPGWLK